MHEDAGVNSNSVCVPEKVSEVDSAIRNLEYLTNRLEDLVGRVDVKLARVSISASPSPDGSKDRMGSAVPLANEIYCLNSRIEHSINAIHDILERIEV